MSDSAGADRRRHAGERAVLLVRRGERQHARGGFGAAPDVAHGRGDIARSFDGFQRRGHGRLRYAQTGDYATLYHVLRPFSPLARHGRYLPRWGGPWANQGNTDILIDLSRDIEHKMAVLPNHPQVIVSPFATHDEVRVADGYGFYPPRWLW